jgi:hypothetical protein
LASHSAAGPHALMVEAKSPERAAEICAQLANARTIPSTAAFPETGAGRLLH